MVEKAFRGEICHAIHQYAQAINKYMEGYDKNKESSFLDVGILMSYMDGQCRKSYL